MVPLVSILIPAFNAQEWIADTLESALAQTWPRKEVIVVDDGSTDHTLEVANRFGPRGVRVVGQENRGSAAARNTAYSLCEGEFIQWLDADDLLAPDKIARQMAALHLRTSERTLLSSAWGRFMYRPTRTRFTPSRLWCDLTPVEWLLRKVGENLYMANCSWLVSRTLTEAAGPWNPGLFVDNDGEYFARVLLQSDGVKFVGDAKVLCRLSGFRSVSHVGTSDKKKESKLRSMQLQIQYLRSLEETDRVRAACLAYLQTGLVHFYPERPDLVRRLQALAVDLGGTLQAPRLSWKYSWIGALFGRRTAKRAQIVLPRIRWSLRRLLDRTLLGVERDLEK